MDIEINRKKMKAITFGSNKNLELLSSSTNDRYVNSCKNLGLMIFEDLSSKIISRINASLSFFYRKVRCLPKNIKILIAN